MSDLLATYLTDRDVPCPNCAYNLRDLTTDRCPECGLQVQLGVHLAEPKLAAFITGLVGLAMASGFSLLLSLFAIVMQGLEGDRLFGEPWVIVVMLWAVTTTLLLVVWITQRRRLRRMSDAMRATLVITSWFVTGCVFVSFVWSIFQTI